MIDWEQRTLKMRKVSSFNTVNNFYDYIINEWIPAQPDYPELMRLFIGMRFNLLPWFFVVKFKRNWMIELVKAMDKRDKRRGKLC